MSKSETELKVRVVNLEKENEIIMGEKKKLRSDLKMTELELEEA